MEAQNIPLQIISIDNEQNQFQLDEKLFKSVLRKIPPNMKVAIVSVVGAFRTGKSFLLDFFLRYLRLPQDEAGEIAWEQMFASGEKLEGNINASSFHKTEEKDDEEKEVNNIDNNNKDNNHSNGFSWRAGRDTNTTGIWVWSEPFVRKISTGEEVAVLLVDTQGMFDNTLSQLLTTSIFGLSTLLSSYQVYNVKFQIQEDQLQHLSLFAEYGRVALQEGEESSDNENETPSSSKPTSRPPFQTLQFLVRDWNEFEDLEQKDLDDMKTLEASMTEYLTHVLATNEKSNDDLVSVRKHIKDCFETVDAFLLPHPGFEVIKKNYDGDFGKIRSNFKQLMRHYVHALFEERLQPKCIHGSYVTGEELLTYVKAYTTVFCKAEAFPECKTLLNAVADANNRNAYDRSKKIYSQEMKKYCGAGQEYRQPNDIEEHSKIVMNAAILKFNRKATYGSKVDIIKFRDLLKEDCLLLLDELLKLNEERDPIAAIPQGYMMIVGFAVAYILRVANDWVFCWSTPVTPEFDFEYADICTRWSSLLTFSYSLIFVFIGLAIAKAGNAGLARVKQLVGTASTVAQMAASSGMKKKKSD